MRRLFAAALGVLMILTGISPAATRFNDVHIQVAAITTGQSSFGYVDYQVTISNSGSQAHTVQLIVSQNAYGYGNYVRELTRKVTVPAASAAGVSVFQPPLPMNSHWASVVIDGTSQREQVQFPTVNHCQGNYYFGRPNDSYCLLLSRQVGFDDVNQAMEKLFGDSQTSSGSVYMNNNPYSLALSELPVTEWSQNWLSYSRYNGILLTGAEWQNLPTQVRRALLEYVRCGGSLTIAGQDGLDGTDPFGRTREGIFEKQYTGFGVLTSTSRQDIPNWDRMDWEVLRRHWRGTSRVMQNNRDIKEANDWFPVIDNLSIPVRGLLLIVLIFAILIGPVNLFFLARKKRQIWLLWTVPLLSLIASVIVFGYATFAEGWSGYERTQSLTILDEREKLASTVGITAFYCPLTPRDGLHFDYETECTPQVELYSSGSVRGREIDWTEEQHLKSGWVASRVPSHFKLRKSQMRREKMVFSQDAPDQWLALNGLGVPVETLYYADADGRVYHAEQIEPGKKIRLQPMDNAVTVQGASAGFARTLFETDWHAAIDAMVESPANYLRPNCYIAIVREPLFVEQPLRERKSEIVESVVYGISEGVADAG